MAQSDVLREFLVELGFKVDPSSERKMLAALGGVTKGAIALAATIEAAAASAVAGITKIAEGLDTLYFASQRTRASTENLRTFGYAISQLGGSYAGAQASVEAFALAMRSSPGPEGFLKSIGIQTRDANGHLKDSVDLFRQLGGWLAHNGNEHYVNAQIGQKIFHLDDESVRLLETGKLDEAFAKAKESARQLGLNADEAAANSNKLMTQLRELQKTIDDVATKISGDLAPKITQWVKEFNAWVRDHHQEIEDWLQGVVQAASDLADAFFRLAGDMKPVFDYFNSLSKVGGALDTLEKIERAVNRIGRAFSLFGSGNLSGGLGSLFGGLGDLDRATQIVPGSGEPAAADTRNIWQRHAPKWLGGKDAPTVEAGTGIGHIASRADRVAFIRKEAIARGIDPNVAVATAAGEGLNKYAGDLDATGKPTSFGDFQLHYPGIGRNTAGGLGTQFTQETGLDARDPRTWREQTKWALDYAAKKRSWVDWHGHPGPLDSGFGPDTHPVGWRLTPEEEAAKRGRPKEAAPGGPGHFSTLLTKPVQDNSVLGALMAGTDFGHATGFQATPLGPGASTFNTNHVPITQTTTINVDAGGQNPQEIAGSLGRLQDGVNNRLQRNVQGAVR